ncbi:MAG: hypothetical protein SH818_18450 [Saprospiraceae bacterium]|nr:hypothetical protein [Saprospiraceae bacterium]
MKTIFFILGLAILFFAGCKSNTEKQDEAKDTETIENAVDNIEESAGEAADRVKDMFDGITPDKDLKLVEIADLKKLLPEKLNGLTRERIKGEGVGALGFKMNQAEAEYEKGDKRIELHIIDFGGFGPAMLALASWTVTDIYREDEDGYEKVTEWKGYKTFEKSNQKDKTSSVSIIYKNRLIVNAEADGMDIDDLKELLEDEILDELDDLEIKTPVKR